MNNQNPQNTNPGFLKTWGPMLGIQMALQVPTTLAQFYSQAKDRELRERQMQLQQQAMRNGGNM